jgi:hypothetical protein
MRRVALALLVATGCGDNGPSCGYVDVVLGLRNVWAPQFAVDDNYVYYADYDVDGFGTQFVLRMNHGGGGIQALATRSPFEQQFGIGLTVDATSVYWTGSSQPTGFSLYASPIKGGQTIELTTLPPCTPFAVAANDTEVFAGTASCEDNPSQVFAVTRADKQSRIAWTGGEFDGDVRALAATADTLYVGTTVALFAVRASGTQLVKADGAVRDIEVHDGVVYYSVENVGIYAGGDRVYTYDPATKGEGAFSVDGDDLYVAEPPRMMFETLTERHPQVVVEHLGDTVTIVAHGGYAYWSALVQPGAPGPLDTFSGGISRVTRPCL